MKKTVVPIRGMHCKSCELLVEDELSKIPGVKRTEVSQLKASACIYHTGSLNNHSIEKAIHAAGYKIGTEYKPWISKDFRIYEELAVSGIAAIFLYLVIRNLNIGSLSIVKSNNYGDLPIVFLVGLSAGLSTCMALVGGLVLGISARFSKSHPYANSSEKFIPHLFFNFGRILSFFILGALIGAAGSIFQLSPTALGILTLIVGVSMLIVGFQLTELSPRISQFSISLPKSVSRIFGITENKKDSYSHKDAMILGALTFFLPCGFTQAMQLYAISTGNPIRGALTMGIFAIGTAPGLLGVGGLTSYIQGKFARYFFKFAGIVVLSLAIFNISNGLNLTSVSTILPISIGPKSTLNNNPTVPLIDGIQVIHMTQTNSGYSPDKFTVKKGIPVKWIVDSQDPYSCASSIISQKIGVRKALKSGENVIEFTPNETGSIPFSCSMGMYRGVITVVDEQTNTPLSNKMLADLEK